VRIYTTSKQQLVAGAPRTHRWWFATLVLCAVITLFAGYWVFHCADDAVTPEFCAKALSTVMLVVLPGLVMTGRIVREPRPSFVSASPPRLYRPPRLSLA
jgi:hypothetical protein